MDSPITQVALIRLVVRWIEWRTAKESRGDETTVALFDNLFGPHVDNLQRSLSRTAVRNSLLNANLANLNTPGYKRKDASFAIELEKASSSRELMNPGGDRRTLLEGPTGGRSRDDGAVQTDQRSVRVDGSSVSLEDEVVAIAETELRYQTLAQLTTDYFSGLKNVIREGR